jgi:TRAP-type mannitol/chloroaromatic compound transport system substrate-binding protein
MFKTTKKALMGAALGALLAAPVSGMAAEQWSMATAWGGGPFLKDHAEGYARLVEKLTGGSIKIQVFPGGTLGKALKVSDTVKSGVAQIGHTWMGYDWGIDKTVVVLSGMAGGLQPEEMLMWLWYAGGAELSNEFRKEKFGVIGIPCGIFPTEIFLHSKKKIQTLADFQGLKMRTAGAWAEIAGSLGASTVILPGAEVYPALERGVIDATEWSSPSINLPSGFHKIAKYVIMPGIHQPAAVQECVVNMDAYNRITDAERDALWEAAKINMLDTWGKVAYEDIGALEEMRKSGNEFVQLSPEFINAAKDASEQWADKQAETNEWFAKALAHRRAFQEHIKSGWNEFRFPIGTGSTMMK